MPPRPIDSDCLFSLSSRPRGTTRRLHSGKGLTLVDAYVGALMEAVEYAVAENASARGPDVWLPSEGACRRAPLWGLLGRLRAATGRRTAEDSGRPECTAKKSSANDSAVARGTLWCRVALDGGIALFGWSTNGLASGNTLERG